MKYNPALDGVRAFAVVTVVLQHAEIPAIAGGFVGVDLFFVLSGYLITSILAEEAASTGQIAIGSFLWNRAVRLMPPLALLLVTLNILGPLFWPGEPIALITLLVAMYLTDYVSAFYGDFSMMLHTWSLAVEEQFYLLWPLAVLLLARFPKNGKVRALAIAYAAATLWRVANAWYFPEWSMSAYRLDTRASGLILGAIVATAKILLKGRAADLLGAASLAILLILILTLTPQPLPVAFVQPIVELAAAGLIVSLAAAENSAIHRLFSIRPLVYCGVLSYSVYLWHYPISRALLQYTADWRAILPLMLAASLMIAAMSYELLERPLKIWRHRKYARP